MAMSRPRKASAYNLTARRARTPSRVSLSRPADGLTVQISTRELACHLDFLVIWLVLRHVAVRRVECRGSLPAEVAHGFLSRCSE